MIFISNYLDYRSGLAINHYWVRALLMVLMLCNGIERVKSAGDLQKKDESPEYYQYLKNIARVRQEHEARLVELQKVRQWR